MLNHLDNEDILLFEAWKMGKRQNVCNVTMIGGGGDIDKVVEIIKECKV